MIDFDMVVAADAAFGIGKGGDMPWHIPTDLKYFKNITTGAPSEGQQNAVIMGRKTWHSIPERFRPLPNRLNVVLTRQLDWTPKEDAMVAHSLDDALEQLSSREDIHEVFVVGGGEIYRQSIHHTNCRSLYITQINSSFDCDTHFPDPRDTFRLKEEGQQLEENGFLFSFTRWERVY